MSAVISEKKVSVKKYSKKREDLPFRQKVNVFADKQKKKFVKSFEGVVQNLKPRIVLSENYKKFVNKVNNPVNRKIVRMLPVVLLSLTVLAVKNKRLIKPILDAYQTSMPPGVPNSVADKAVFVVKEYAKYFTSLNAIESLEMGLSTLSFFLEDIPAVFERLDTQHGLSQLTLHKNIFKNMGDLKREFIDKPKKDKKERDLLQDQKKNQQEQKKIQQAQKERADKLQRDMEAFLATNNQGSSKKSPSESEDNKDPQSSSSKKVSNKKKSKK